MKSLTGAMEIMTETRHAFQLIYNELLEEQVKIHLGTRECSALFGLFMLEDLLRFHHYCTTLLADQGIGPR